MISTAISPIEKFGLTSQERVNKALNHLRNGKGIILIDDEDRENEGDLIFSAHRMNVQDMALLIRECSGIVCLCLTNEKADQLDLPYMVEENSSQYQTPFTVSIEAKEGVTTGVSAADRMTTIQTACTINAKPTDLSKPGHVFPLRAKNNGILERKGHTEGSIDLMKLAYLPPEAVLCELMNEDGTMSNIDELLIFAEQHDLVVVAIEDILHYRTFVRDYN